jgi:hypothetical protein
MKVEPIVFYRWKDPPAADKELILRLRMLSAARNPA